MIINYSNPQQLLAELQKSLDETLSYGDLPAKELQKTYAPGKWTVQQLLHHLADAESVLLERIRRGIAKPGQVVYGFDQDAWAEGLVYEGQNLVTSMQLYQSCRLTAIELAQRFYDSHGHQQYVHSETGLRTVKEEFDKVAWHNEHHLRQIRQALGIKIA